MMTPWSDTAPGVGEVEEDTHHEGTEGVGLQDVGGEATAEEVWDLHPMEGPLQDTATAMAISRSKDPVSMMPLVPLWQPTVGAHLPRGTAEDSTRMGRLLRVEEHIMADDHLARRLHQGVTIIGGPHQGRPQHREATIEGRRQDRLQPLEATTEGRRQAHPPCLADTTEDHPVDRLIQEDIPPTDRTRTKDPPIRLTDGRLHHRHLSCRMQSILE